MQLSLGIDHFAGHATINHKVLAGNETSFLREKIVGEGCNIVRCAHAPGWVLLAINGAVFNGLLACWLLPVAHFYPAWANRIHANVGSKANR